MQRIRNSFWALLGRQTPEAPAVVVERVRLAMLWALDAHGDKDLGKLNRSILGARDLTDLWYLRPDLMQAIAARRDEATAQRVLRSITELFKGHFSGANDSRF